MSMDRREFIKIAGLSTLFGLGGKGLFEVLRPGAVDASEGHGESEAHEEAAPAGPAVRLAMLVDVRKCQENPTCNKCKDACDYAHNVPYFPNPKEEVKWIWKDDYEATFPDTGNDMMGEGLEGGAVPSSVQPL